jgi:hypothetical protein
MHQSCSLWSEKHNLRELKSPGDGVRSEAERKATLDCSKLVAREPHMKREDKLGIDDDWDVRKRPVNRTTKLNGGCTKHCCCGIRQPTSCPQALCLTLLVCPLTETAKTTENIDYCSNAESRARPVGTRKVRLNWCKANGCQFWSWLLEYVVDSRLKAELIRKWRLHVRKQGTASATMRWGLG